MSAAAFARRMAQDSAALLAAAVGLPACAPMPGPAPVVADCHLPSTQERPGPALVGQRYGMAMTPIPLDSVQFGGPETARAMAVQNLYATRTPTGTVQVSARFVSCLDQPASVRVRTSFVRADTSPAEAPTPWRLVFLEPRATALYSELSASTDASAYLIEVAR